MAAHLPGNRNAQTAEHNRQMTRPFVKRHAGRSMESITPLEAQQWAIRYPGQVALPATDVRQGAAGRAVTRNVWDTVEIPSRRRHNDVRPWR